MQKNVMIAIVVGILIIAVVALSWNKITGHATGSEVCTCISCEDCIAKLKDSSCGEVRLTQDILDHYGDCILSPSGFNKKIFDCGNHLIRGQGVGYAIRLTETFDNIIKNCKISNFDYGLRTYNGKNDIIKNMEICGNDMLDVYDENGNNDYSNNVCDTSNLAGTCVKVC